MPPIIVEPSVLGEFVLVRIVDEVPYLLTFLLVVLAFLFIFDLGFDIEELGSAVSLATLSTMALPRRAR